MRAVAIVDYGMGNIRSLAKALERAGATVSRISTEAEIRKAERLVLPGQGAFGQAMGRLGPIAEALTESISEKPFLGVCLGLQLLYRRSEEAPEAQGLGLIDEEVTLLPVGGGLKRPHMGWSPVRYGGDHPVLRTMDGEAFYFVHSYAARSSGGVESAEAQHGEPFVAAVAADGWVATQFHPEKSQGAGATLLETWLRT